MAAVTEAQAEAASDRAAQAGLKGAVDAANARAQGAKLAAGKTKQTEYAKGI
jgi:hypothetical protein